MTIRSSSGSNEVGDRLDAEARRQHTAGSYILVVDDEAAVRDFMARCLEAEGYSVRRADSAAEALELMISEPAAMVLCDIRMPGQDGLWLAERVHSHWPQIPIVMATAIDDLQTVRTSRDLGAVDYISKPVTPAHLLDVVRRVAPTLAHSHPAAAEPIPQEETLSPDDRDDKIEADYTLETPVRCPACGERIETLKAVRLIRARVNFTSTFPRRGRLLACPHCLAIVPAELTNF